MINTNWINRALPHGSHRREIARKCLRIAIYLRHPGSLVPVVKHYLLFCIHTIREIRPDPYTFAYIRQRGILSYLANVHTRHQSPEKLNEFLYAYWIQKNEKSFSLSTKEEIKILIVTAGGDIEIDHLLLNALKNLDYSKWALVYLARDNKTGNRTVDSRITTVRFQNAEDFCSRLNRVVAESDIQFILFLPPGTLPAQASLRHIAKFYAKRPADIYYGDHDLVSINGFRHHPHFKPEFGIESFRSYNFVEDMIAIKRSFFVSLDGLRNGMPGAEIYDFMLRAVDAGAVIERIPHVLFHMRDEGWQIDPHPTVPAAPQNGEISMDKPYRLPCHSTMARAHDSRLKFSIIILNKDAPHFIIPLIESLIGAPGLNRNFEVIVGDTGSRDNKVLNFYRKVSGSITIVRNLKYHFSKNNNLLATCHAKGQYVGFMNNDIILPNLNFLDAIEEVLTQDVTGTVGVKLVYPDNRFQHGGVFFIEKGDLRGLPYHRLHGQPDKGQLATCDVETVPAVTGAFLFCRFQDFIEVGGFNPKYQEEAQDIDFCLRMLQRGKKNFFINLQSIVHIENGTRDKGSENMHDRLYFLQNWHAFFETFIDGMPLNHDRFRPSGL